MTMAAGNKVFVTRLVPEAGVNALKSAGCSVTQWKSHSVISREELVKQVQGIDGLFCMLTDKIDKEILNSAGCSL